MKYYKFIREWNKCQWYVLRYQQPQANDTDGKKNEAHMHYVAHQLPYTEDRSDKITHVVAGAQAHRVHNFYFPPNEICPKTLSFARRHWNCAMHRVPLPMQAWKNAFVVPTFNAVMLNGDLKEEKKKRTGVSVDTNVHAFMTMAHFCGVNFALFRICDMHVKRFVVFHVSVTLLSWIGHQFVRTLPVVPL